MAPSHVRCTPRDSEAGDRGHINCGSLIFGIPGQVLTMDEKYNVKKNQACRLESDRETCGSNFPHSAMGRCDHHTVRK